METAAIHRYIPEPYKGRKTRSDCMYCGGKGEFTHYIDRVTGERVADGVGICNRANCPVKNYPPRQYFQDNGITPPRIDTGEYKIKPKPIKMRYIDYQTFKTSLTAYNTNSLVQYLLTLFDTRTVQTMITSYCIGTSGSRWKGACIFWYITKDGKIKAGQVKLFDKGGHTATEQGDDGQPTSCTTWIHAILRKRYKDQNQQPPTWLSEYIDSDCKVNTLYGEHLLNIPENKVKPVAVVEAPKTAIIASGYMPQFCWVAAGALDYLTAERCEVLRGRDVTLFPDLGKGFEVWSRRAKELQHITTFKVSTVLEDVATEEERKRGLDLADFLVKTHAGKIPLRDRFKEDLLKLDNGGTPEQQVETFRMYACQGLSPEEAKEVLKELLDNHGFTTEEPETLIPGER